jgi:hypothetical protein
MKIINVFRMLYKICIMHEDWAHVWEHKYARTGVQFTESAFSGSHAVFMQYFSMIIGKN